MFLSPRNWHFEAIAWVCCLPGQCWAGTAVEKRFSGLVRSARRFHQILVSGKDAKGSCRRLGGGQWPTESRPVGLPMFHGEAFREGPVLQLCERVGVGHGHFFDAGALAPRVGGCRGDAARKASGPRVDSVGRRWTPCPELGQRVHEFVAMP